jgi:uncharacterized membrane protein YbhN (UPF0104 family)
MWPQACRYREELFSDALLAYMQKGARYPLQEVWEAEVSTVIELHQIGASVYGIVVFLGFITLLMFVHVARHWDDR